MTVTFHAHLNHTKLPRKLVRCVDLYPGLDNKDFAGNYLATMDQEGYYCENVIDVNFTIDAVFSNDKFDAILRCIDPNMAAVSRYEGNAYQIGYRDIPEFKRKVIKAINSSKTQSSVQNLRYSYADIIRGLNAILSVCTIAMEYKTFVYWT